MKHERRDVTLPPQVFLMALGLILLGVLARVLPHPDNFAPVGAIALFGGAVFASRWSAVLVPLAAMFAGDTVLTLATGRGYHVLMLLVYATYALIAILGTFLRGHRRSATAVGAGVVASSTIFYLITNFAMWMVSEMFPRTLEGLVACYVAGVPYFGRTLLADAMFAAIFFGVYALAERHLGSLEASST